jgi:hypothetical protein
MFQSPHRMNSRPEAFIAFIFGRNRLRNANLRACASSDDEPEGT